MKSILTYVSLMVTLYVLTKSVKTEASTLDLFENLWCVAQVMKVKGTKMHTAGISRIENDKVYKLWSSHTQEECRVTASTTAIAKSGASVRLRLDVV